MSRVQKSKKAGRPKKTPVTTVDPNLPYLTIEEAAIYLRRAPGTIRTMLHSRELKASRIGDGGQPIISRQHLDHYVASRSGFLAPYRKGTRPAVADRWESYRSKKEAA